MAVATATERRGTGILLRRQVTTEELGEKLLHIHRMLLATDRLGRQFVELRGGYLLSDDFTVRKRMNWILAVGQYERRDADGRQFIQLLVRGIQWNLVQADGAFHSQFVVELASQR